MPSSVVKKTQYGCSCWSRINTYLPYGLRCHFHRRSLLHFYFLLNIVCNLHMLKKRPIPNGRGRQRRRRCSEHAYDDMDMLRGVKKMLLIRMIDRIMDGWLNGGMRTHVSSIFCPLARSLLLLCSVYSSYSHTHRVWDIRIVTGWPFHLSINSAWKNPYFLNVRSNLGNIFYSKSTLPGSYLDCFMYVKCWPMFWVNNKSVLYFPGKQNIHAWKWWLHRRRTFNRGKSQLILPKAVLSFFLFLLLRIFIACSIHPRNEIKLADGARSHILLPSIISKTPSSPALTS